MTYLDEIKRKKRIAEVMELPDQECLECGEPMKGIKANDMYNTRVICESCGGNHTKHNPLKPKEGSIYWRRIRYGY